MLSFYIDNLSRHLGKVESLSSIYFSISQARKDRQTDKLTYIIIRLWVYTPKSDILSGGKRLQTLFSEPCPSWCNSGCHTRIALRQAIFLKFWFNGLFGIARDVKHFQTFSGQCQQACRMRE